MRVPSIDGLSGSRCRVEGREKGKINNRRVGESEGHEDKERTVHRQRQKARVKYPEAGAIGI